MSFAFWRQESSQATTGYALFGKLPLRADFVRVNAAIPVAQEYDQLLADAISALAQDAGWQSAYDITDASLFAYRSADHQSWFVGGQAPSRDGQGRRFPLVAGISRAAADIDADLPLLPLAYEVFYNGVADHLENAIANSVDAVSCRNFLEGFAGDALQTGTDFDLPRSLLQRFKREQSATYLATILRMAYP